MKKIFGMISIAIIFNLQAFAAPIVISNQASTSSITISNQPDQVAEAFTVFEEGYRKLSSLITLNTGKSYFTQATLTSPSTKTITLQATSAWESETDTTKASILAALQSLWNDALGNTSGHLVVHITQ